jgi:dephospho-CoA kinase
MSSSCADAFASVSLPDRWKHGAVPVIGLTGEVGGGKSRVATLLGRRGAVVIDADVVGHKVLERPVVRRQVIERFGAGVVSSVADPGAAPGPIDRGALGSIVFAAKSALHDLEAIVHPEMRQQFEAIIDREAARGLAPAVVLDAAILLEAGWDDLCDLVVFVAAPLPCRLQRVARERGWTADVLQARAAAQWPGDTKRSRANVVLHNDSSLELLDQNVDRLFRLVRDREFFDSSDAAASDRFVGSACKSSGAVPLLPGDAR